MALDVRVGDLLIVAGREYPIKTCSEWASTRMNSFAFRRMATISAQTKRIIKAAPTLQPGTLKCTPLDPVDPETRRRLALESPHELLQTFIADGSGFVHLVIEDIKR